jgi:YbgC/YbaW family acyl-CoA thioester hydrolase
MKDSQPLPKVLENTVLIRFQDCDPYGHLNNARYIDYFLNARQDQLAQYYDFHIFADGRLMNHNWVVSKTHIAYLQPAGIMEETVVTTCLIQMGQRSLVVEAVMLDKSRRRVKAFAWIEFIYFSLDSGRAASHPENLMDFFKAVIVNDIFEPDGFNQRAEAVRNEYRKRDSLTANPGVDEVSK